MEFKPKYIGLIEDLKKCRTDRPDEWTMDRFICAAEQLTAGMDLLVEQLRDEIKDLEQEIKSPLVDTRLERA